MTTGKLAVRGPAPWGAAFRHVASQRAIVPNNPRTAGLQSDQPYPVKEHSTTEYPANGSSFSPHREGLIYDHGIAKKRNMVKPHG